MLKHLLKSRKLLFAQLMILAGLALLLRTLYYTDNVSKTVPNNLSRVELQTVQITRQPIDNRKKILADYLAKYNSPLQPYAGDFVDAADANGLDWRLVAAISGVESTFGKHTPGSPVGKTISYNGWGWGVYGTQALYFKSWTHGIYTVSEGLGKNYVAKGRVTPDQIGKIYAASPTWSTKVKYFLNDIDKFAAASNYPDSRLEVEYLNISNVAENLDESRHLVAATSAMIADRPVEDSLLTYAGQ